MSGRSRSLARAPRPTSPRRLGGDEGAVLVEAIMVLPILFALLCGLIDFGVGMRDRQLLQSAGRSAARTAAGAGTYSTGREADRFAMTTLWASLQNVQNLTIDKVIVFRANPTSWTTWGSTAQSALPAACLTSPPTGACNVYSESQVRNAAATWSYTDNGPGCTAGTGYDQYWCPTTRKMSLADNGGYGPDYLGVYVKATYTPFTQFYRKSITMEDITIVRLEPK
jgi:Flp pilus assembly protein TadG